MRTCHAINCHHTVADDMLFCPAHYRDVPAEIQRSLRDLWRMGEKYGTKAIERRWLYTALLARNALAKMEGYKAPVIAERIKQDAQLETV